jgi:hypothetical protein
MRRDWFALLTAVVAIALLPFFGFAGEAGETLHTTQYKVLAPITQGNLTIFPVVTYAMHDTSGFLTLDEGLRSGDVVITEAGRVQGLVRRPGVRPMQYGSGAQVNQLVLVNNSKRPLLLLAGEIVTGGKQDRIIGKDRIVPVGADPIDLTVFCVEPGRWTERSAQFAGAAGGVAGGTFMAQPAVRGNAMATKNQQQVWDSVNKNNSEAKAMLSTAAPAAAGAIGGTTSYAEVMGNREVQRQIDKVAAPVAQNYEQLMPQLRERNAVGVVVAVGGHIIWADIFASTDLLKKYWPKLARSYAVEAMFQGRSDAKPSQADAEKFLAEFTGRHEVVDSEPDIYRHAEITGDGFKAFQLTSLLPKTGFDLHLAKMSQ